MSHTVLTGSRIDFWLVAKCSWWKYLRTYVPFLRHVTSKKTYDFCMFSNNKWIDTTVTNYMICGQLECTGIWSSSGSRNYQDNDQPNYSHGVMNGVHVSHVHVHVCTLLNNWFTGRMLLYGVYFRPKVTAYNIIFTKESNNRDGVITSASDNTLY